MIRKGHTVLGAGTVLCLNLNRGCPLSIYYTVHLNCVYVSNIGDI